MGMLMRHAAMSSVAPSLYSDDVFSTYLYTGNGSTQTITNGIDLAGKGGLVWIKDRVNGTNWNSLATTNLGAGKYLSTNSTNILSNNAQAVTAFNANGFSVGNGPYENTSADTYASWTFRKAAKFFDVVTYTGNDVDGRQIAHTLGVTPGMIIIKKTSGVDDWYVYHRSAGTGGANGGGLLNSTAAWDTTASWFGGPGNVSVAPTASVFTIRNLMNTSGATYVAYLFAHDPDTTNGIIQAGSFTTDGSGNATASLGWEPQWVLIKQVSAAGDSWYIQDSMRGLNVLPVTSGKNLQPNASSAEAGNVINITNTGLTYYGGYASSTFIYLAIRRPNKPPTSGTQVYNAIARTGTGAAATVTGVGFAPDAMISEVRNQAGYQHWWVDRLRGNGKELDITTTAAETTYISASDFQFDATMDGIKVDSGNSINSSAQTYINHFFKRAPGVFDIVAYTGDGTANRAISHNLGVAPELIIAKSRTAIGTYWRVLWSGSLSNSLNLNGTSSWADLAGNAPYFFGNGTTSGSATAPTATSFYVANETNASSQNIIAYLFATKAGISKVGSYTGNGTSQTINCGFAAGCRFFLVKATSTTGSWWVWDSTRGVVASTDFGLQLNSTAAETTSADAVDPDASGIIVNQEATCSINANGVSYIYLAIA